MSKEFKVIKIIDDTSLIINGGLVNGIEKGDMVEISGKGETIFDPETNENLGQLQIVKARLDITKIYEKMCICESSSYTSTYFAALAPIFSSTQQKLDVAPEEISGEGDKTIRIGDIAKLIKRQKPKEQKDLLAPVKQEEEAKKDDAIAPVKQDK